MYLRDRYLDTTNAQELLMPRPRSIAIDSYSRYFYAALAIAGSLLFAWGGKSHPKVSTFAGTPGSLEFFQDFAHHVVHHPNWEAIHSAILAGPVLWALAVIG